MIIINTANTQELVRSLTFHFGPYRKLESVLLSWILKAAKRNS